MMGSVLEVSMPSSSQMEERLSRQNADRDPINQVTRYNRVRQETGRPESEGQHQEVTVQKQRSTEQRYTGPKFQSVHRSDMTENTEATNPNPETDDNQVNQSTHNIKESKAESGSSPQLLQEGD